MGENVIALKALYTALGGDADDVANITTIADMIYKLAAIAPSMAGLPAVSATNNGKILKVVDGAWALADDAIEA